MNYNAKEKHSRIKAKLSCLLVLILFAFLHATSPSFAQEVPQPGTACTGAENGQLIQIGGPEQSGGGSFVYCNGTNWKKVLGYNNAGITIPTLANSDFTCPDGNEIKYHAASGGMYCDVDITPDAFAFVNQNDVWLSTLTSSNTVTIGGLEVDVPVSITGSGAQFRINGGSWGTSGTIGNGDTLQLRLTSSPSWSTTLSTNITVGDTTVSWSVRTVDEDLTPDAFNFTDLYLQEHNTLVTSNTVTINGINSNPTVSVSGAGSPQISINGGAWGTSGTITNGQTLQVRLTTANASATLRSATISINGVSDTWNVTTKDITPAAFDFTNQSGLTRSALTYSNTVTITGIDVATAVTISGGGAQFSINGGAWGTTGNITNGQTLRLRMTSSASFSTAVSTTVTVGTVSDAWSITTYARDVTPNAFSFTDQTMQPYNTLTYSNTITIGGINDGTAVSVSGTGSPQISINGGAWGTSGTITNGQTLRVRLTTANAASTTRSAVVDVGGVTDTWSVSTYDRTPAAFDFTNQTGQVLNTWIYSNSITVTGINTPTPISITGAGVFSINGAAYGTSGTITNGQTLRLAIKSSTAFSTTVSTTVTVGTVSDAWNVTTYARDVTPNAFNFTDKTMQAYNTWIYSNTVTIGGINDGTAVSISGASGTPQFQIAGGSWVTSGTITNGQTLRLRMVSANAASTTRSATVNVGGVTDAWSVSTYDITPAAFDFTNQTGQVLNTWIYSNSITVTDINTPTPISITGAGVFSINGAAYGTSGTITNGQTLRLAIKSSTAFSTTVSTTVTVGTVSDAWNVTTLARDTTPNAFSFTDLTNQVKNTLVYSNTITISGINDGTTVIQSGQGSPQFSINGGSWVTSGTITNGQTLRLRLTTPNADNSTYGVTVDVGGVTDTWYATTRWTYAWYEGNNWSSCSGTNSDYGSWYDVGSCSASCGGGTQSTRQDCRYNRSGSQSQTVQCRRSDNTVVADANCSGTKPAVTRSCTMPCCCGSYKTSSYPCNTQSCCTPGPSVVMLGNSATSYTDDCGHVYTQVAGCWTGDGSNTVDSGCMVSSSNLRLGNVPYNGVSYNCSSTGTTVCKANGYAVHTCGKPGDAYQTYGLYFCSRKFVR